MENCYDCNHCEVCRWIDKFKDKGVCDFYENGIPLKNHSKLIDVGQCDRKLFYRQCGGANSLITVKSAFDMLMSLPTIVEEDTESEDKR